MTLTEAVKDLRLCGEEQWKTADMLEAMERALRNAEIDRDTYHLALKAIHCEVNNEWRKPYEILAAIAWVTDQIVANGAK